MVKIIIDAVEHSQEQEELYIVVQHFQNKTKNKEKKIKFLSYLSHINNTTINNNNNNL